MLEILPFVLCGGAGTRLWPLSRESLPKQFHNLTNSDTLFQQTCRRFQGEPFGHVSVIGSQRHRFLILDQLEELGLTPNNIILEPVGRNTAPAACISALITARANPSAIILLTPADHVIRDSSTFSEAIMAGMSAAEEGALVTFGIEPDCAHTGYGYIEVEKGNQADLRVGRFVEKPSREAAEAFLDSGNYYWNAGVFLFTAQTMLELFENLAPAVLKACERSLHELEEDLGFLRLNGAYHQVPAVSLDYAIAEKAENIRCVPLGAGWSDVGSWSAVWDVLEKDEKGNASFGAGEILFDATRDSLIYSDRACVAALGLSDVVVIATEDAVLVASKDYAEAVKRIVEELKKNGRAQALEHARVYRPWGWYQSLHRGDRYQVKCIMVKPGGRLSLQSHMHRSEHWVVVKGTLEVTRGEEVELLSENESTYIPIGKKHRLANPGKIPAFLVEVQSGAYLGEDDIIRFEDLYRRGPGDY